MADIPGNATTTATVTVGSTTEGVLEVVGDHDWYAIQLVAGQAITVALNGETLNDPYLRIHDSTQAVIFQNDDASGGTTNSLVSFAAPSSGTYYIDAAAFNDAGAGTYQLVVRSYTPPGPGTVDQFASQLTSGYWGGDTHHFNVTQGGSITVNLTGLTAAGQNLAHNALALWSDIIGVSFPEVTTGGQITFDDNQTGSFSDGVWSGGITSSAHVNVSTAWLTNYGTGLDSYSFQSYIHEIGHALGLGHSGDYNNDATYPFDATYSNDGWPMSVMSYFDQTESSYYADRGFTEEYVITPMIADVVAVGNLYGMATTTRTGDTTYGFNSTAGRPEYDARQFPTASYTIVDDGGNDTLDYSGFTQNQVINLNPETFSNVGGEVGNVSIARGTVIENAIGGSGNDIIIGNSANNVLQGGPGADTLTGGGGADTFQGSSAQLNGDHITDFSAQDRIVITDASAGAFSFSQSGSTLAFNGALLTLDNFAGGSFVASAAAGGGVQLTMQSGQASPQIGQGTGATSDFNGDGRSDILWRNDSGALSDWLGQADGSLAGNDANAFQQVPTSWHVVGTGDFNGDHRDDILWRNDSGALSDWLGTASGGFTTNDANAASQVPTSWHVVGTGDFNGDHRDDILWRNDSGALSDWLGTSSGGFTANDANAFQQVPTSWSVAGTGDFNGDGRQDILWRNDNGALSDWLGTASGGFNANDGNALTSVPTSWHIVGTGDFNGDGRADILWRNDNGALSDWLGTASGGFIANDANAYAAVPTSWHVAGVGDYNGDGRDDILWRNDSGALSDWLGQPNGGFVSNDAHAFTSVPTSWHVQAAENLFV